MREVQGLLEGPVTSEAPSGASAGAGPLPPHWRAWLAESLWKEDREEVLLPVLEARGFSRERSLAAIREIEAHPWAEAGVKLARRARKLEWQARVRGTLARLSPDYGRVERRSGVSREEFLERYYIANRPVILTDVVSRWREPRRWTPQVLRERFGDAEIEVTSGRAANPLYDMQFKKHLETTTLRAYADRVLAAGAETNDFYMTSNNRNLERSGLLPLLEEFEMCEEYLDPSRRLGWLYLWFGPAGTMTPLHHDTTNNLFHQVYGRKKLWMIPPLEVDLLEELHFTYYSKVDIERPDLAAFPWWKDVRVTEVVLEAGECLLLPIGWWHAVRSLDVSISFSVLNFRWPNKFPDK